MFDLELKNKVAIITGGSDGLGRATARRFASEGAKVVICARREEHLMQAAEDLRKETNGSVLGMKADVCKVEDCTTLIDQTVEEFGGIDILINNAGKSAASGLEALSDEAWQEDLDLKLMGAIRMCRGAVPHMRKMGGGSIVNATTGAGLFLDPVYTSKAMAGMIDQIRKGIIRKNETVVFILRVSR